MSVVVSTGLMYFGLPLLFPNMKADLSEYLQSDDLDEYSETENLTDNGILLQSKSKDITIPFSISSSNQIVTDIPETNMNITIQNNSKIAVTFSSSTVLTLYQIKVQCRSTETPNVGSSSLLFSSMLYCGDLLSARTILAQELKV